MKGCGLHLLVVDSVLEDLAVHHVLKLVNQTAMSVCRPVVVVFKYIESFRPVLVYT